MSTESESASDTAREYYNSRDADNFYARIWGGEDIHVGLYQSEDEPIFDASRRTVEHMADKLSKLDAHTHVLDAGAGYGGSARLLAKNYGCRVTCLNISEVQNERNRRMNQEQGLDHLIDVYDGKFEETPFDDAAFDVVWVQDSFLHSGEKVRVLEELDRVLKPGGEFIFTDPMQAPDAKQETLQPVLERIHLDSMGSFEFYKREFARLGYQELEIEDLSEKLTQHYARVGEELKTRAAKIPEISQAYVDRMLKGLGHWVEAGKKGALNWGILHFRKTQ